jgi:hypothetical protein
MRRSFLCPHCGGVLNPNVKIVLRAEYEGHRGLFLFSPQPGNYDAIIPESFHIKRKAQVRFSCPICSKDLTSNRDRTMAEIHFQSSSGAEGTVAFSRVYGHHATYFITDEEVKSFGEHHDEDRMNFWGAGPRR